ncbi:MAG: prepilin-type N-terminal cleavage/methylation domain-containing protein, partial [Proteobacteria bacterium]
MALSDGSFCHRALFLKAGTRNSALGSKSPKGFTLLEVLISITILIFISMAIYQAMTQTFRMRDVLIREGDFSNGIRLSMAIMERDLNMLFSPVAYIPPAKPANPNQGQNPNFPGAFGQGPQQTTAELETAAEMQRLTEFWLPTKVKTGVRLSRFVGEEQKMSFVTASHQRLYKDRPESEFVKVTYELREERDEEYKIEGTRTLVKIVDTNTFD